MSITIIISFYITLILLIHSNTEESNPKFITTKIDSEIHKDSIYICNNKSISTENDITIKTYKEFTNYILIESKNKQEIKDSNSQKMKEKIKKDKKLITLTRNGSVLKSYNSGLSWRSLNDEMFIKGKNKLDHDYEEVGNVRKIVQSKSNPYMFFFLGSNDINWITYDCGETIIAINSGRKIEEIIINPKSYKKILLIAYSKEEDEDNIEYNQNKQESIQGKDLFLSEDGGLKWRIVNDNIDKVSWGISINDHNRIFLLKKGIFSISNDYFQTFSMINNVISYEIINDNVFIIKDPSSNMNMNEIYFSNLNLIDLKFEKVVLNKPVLKYNKVDFLYPTRNKEDVFICLSYINNHISNFNNVTDEESLYYYGSLFMNDFSNLYQLSLNRILVSKENNQFQIFKIQGRLGRYIANVVKISNNENKNNSTTSYDNNNYHINKYNFNTIITFNRGVTWNFLIPPKVDSVGKEYTCLKEENRKKVINLIDIDKNYLFKNNLDISTGLGMILSVGYVDCISTDINDNSYIESEDSRRIEENLFLSTDGGISWSEIKKGRYIFNIGDHGSIIVIASEEETDSIEYSIDQGKSFIAITILSYKIKISHIENINQSLSFIIIGKEIETERGITVGVDFTSIYTHKCRSPENPDTEVSDYQLISDYQYNTIGLECEMGVKRDYIVKNPNVKCYNDEEFKYYIIENTCKCTINDYECDAGYERINGNSSPCIKDILLKDVKGKNEYNCKKVTSKGYRKIPYNKCVNGLDLNPILEECILDEGITTNLLFLFFIITSIIGIGFIYTLIQRFTYLMKIKKMEKENNEDEYLNKGRNQKISNSICNSSINDNDDYEDNDNDENN